MGYSTKYENVELPTGDLGRRRRCVERGLRIGDIRLEDVDIRVLLRKLL